MPTADQLKAIAAYRTARSKWVAAEQALLEAMTDNAEARRTAADDARRAAAAAMAASRIAALGTGDGFDLLSGRHPLLLLPVRIETRFAWDDAAGGWTFTERAGAPLALLVRIFPDVIHEDGHEPELTAGEEDIKVQLEKRLRAARDLQQLDDAWAEAIRRAGPARASWLGEVLSRLRHPGRRPGALSRPSVARLLPDRWVAMVEVDDGGLHIGRSAPVSEPLETGPSPEGMAWMTDFGSALKAGMALVVTGLPDTLVEVRRVTVVGARGTLDPDETSAELSALLDAHHYTDGLELMAPGTPTNSLPGARAGYSKRPELADVTPLERRRFEVLMRPNPLCRPSDDSDGSILAALLGISTTTLAYVRRADAKDQRTGWILRHLLMTATRRHLVRLMGGGILDEVELGQVVDWAVEMVSATGPLPTVRVGTQPYGVLPILVRDAEPAAGSFAALALPVLDALRLHWEDATGRLPWIGSPGADPGATLVRVLQRDAVAQSIGFRPMLGPQLTARVIGTSTAAVDIQRAAAADAIASLGASGAADTGLVKALHLAFAPTLTAPLVEPPNPSGAQRLATSLDLAASTRPDLLLRHDYGTDERPRSLLFGLARLAMLERADALARAAHVANGADPSQWDDEDAPSQFRDSLGTPLRRLEASDPVDPMATLAFHLSESGRNAAAMGDLRGELRWLASRPPGEVEEILRATLGLFSHRLDPWYTGLAVERLRELRGSAPSASGLNVGGYGVVEHLRRSPRQPVPNSPQLYTSPFNGGYVHAPSVSHGAAAAVLRSVHLAHAAAGHGDAFSVDLSSSRVRAGLDLLQGIREGQPLAALLGYRIERLLAEAQLQRLIAPLRAAAPLVAHKLTPGTQPAETVAATNVVDGLTALDEAGYDGEQQPAAQRLIARHAALQGLALSVDEILALDHVLEAAADAIDAVSDLAVAEGVYQTVQGNPVRAGAVVSGLSGASVPPSDPAVVRTPRSGVGVTHRLLVLLGDDASGRTGWPDTPRAVAEPRLEAWARATLPAPDRILLRVRFIDAKGDEVGSLDRLSLQALNENAVARNLSCLGLGALDLVVQADPHETPSRSPLELRLVGLIELLRPDAVQDAQMELVFERHTDWDIDDFGLKETLEIARQLRSVIARGRPLALQDVSPAGAAAATNASAEAARLVNAAAASLLAARKGLEGMSTSNDAQAIRCALFAADQLGVPGAAPSSLRDSADDPTAASVLRDKARAERERQLAALQAQAASVVAELRRRETAEGSATAAELTGRMRIVFGESFFSLPPLVTTASDLSVFAPAATPGGADLRSARAWLARAAPVRAACGALEAAIAYADAVAAVDTAAPEPGLLVAQLGGDPGERWVALAPAGGSFVPGGRTSLVALTSNGVLPSGPVAGLMLDEWVEVVPSSHETTSVTFHCDAPTATAPQALLLGVLPPRHEAWTADSAKAIVTEALSLARLRLVDLDDLSELGQLLPLFVTAEDPAGEGIGLEVETLTEQAP